MNKAIRQGFSLFKLGNRSFSKQEQPCHYKTLGVSVDSSFEEIRKRFFKLAKTHHPDIAKTEKRKAMFQKITEAYGILSNKELRQRYNDSMGYLSDFINEQKSLEFNEDKEYRKYENMVFFDKRDKDHLINITNESNSEQDHFNFPNDFLLIWFNCCLFGLYIGYIKESIKCDKEEQEIVKREQKTYKGMYNKMLPISFA